MPAHRHTVLLFAAVLLEILCQTHWIGLYDKRVVSIAYLTSGLAVGVLVLLRMKRSAVGTASTRMIPGLAAALFLCLAGFTVVQTQEIFRTVPLDYRTADMLPVISVMGERLLHGEPVYAAIPEIWNGVQPVYLPAMWLAYLPAVAGGFDLRWVSVFFVLAAVALPFVWRPAGARWSWPLLLAAIPIGLMFWHFLERDTVLLSMTEEGVVAGFYVLLAVALWRGNPWLTGVALALAALSRYSLGPWIPAWLAFEYFFRSKQNALIAAGTAAALGLCLMAVTGALWHLDVFLALPNKYLDVALAEKDAWAIDPVIATNLGLAKFFAKTDLPRLYTINYLLSFGMPLLLLALYRRFPRRFEPNLFGLGLLKITLTIVLNLLVIPWPYLFYPSAFLSLAILTIYVQPTANSQRPTAPNPPVSTV